MKKEAYRPTNYEKKRYVLSKPEDLKILVMCKQLEKQKLLKEDKNIVRLIKSQLEDDWRKPLVKELLRISKKYKTK